MFGDQEFLTVILVMKGLFAEQELPCILLTFLWNDFNIFILLS